MQERIHDALRRNAVDEALALAQEWAAQAPDDASAQRSLSAALARAGDPAAALVALDQAILLAPDEAGLHFERAALLLRQRDTGAARVALDESLGLDPNHLPSYLAQAQVALAQGDLAEAERLSRTAARIDADDPRLVALNALLALRRGEPDAAIALASAASVQLRDDPQLLSVLGFGYLAKQHWAFAEQAFRRVSELLPDARALWPLLAQLAARQGRPDEAFERVAPLLADPATATPALRRAAGLHALQAGRGEEALEHLRAALSAGPDRAVLRGLMALWRERNDREDALATLEAALATSPASGDLWGARLALETPGTAEGNRVLQRWLAAMPDHVPALETAMFDRDRAGDLAAVAGFAGRLVQLQPGHPAAEQFLVEARLAGSPAGPRRAHGRGAGALARAARGLQRRPPALAAVHRRDRRMAPTGVCGGGCTQSDAGLGPARFGHRAGGRDLGRGRWAGAERPLRLAGAGRSAALAADRPGIA